MSKVASLEKYDENFLIPQLKEAISAENVRTVRVSLSLDTADLAKGYVRPGPSLKYLLYSI
jgi:hypothetical protein